MRLSRQTVATLTLLPGKTELIIFDEVLPGFGVRLRAGGKRVWIAQYRMGAKQRRITIGSVQAIDPDEARRRAKEVLAHAQLGKDPQADKAEARAKAALTLGSVVERYLDRHAALRLKPKTLADTQRYLRHHWRPLHPLPLHKVERRHAAVYLAEIATSNGPIAANRARAALSALFTWRCGRGLSKPTRSSAPIARCQSARASGSCVHLAGVW